jgi:hypothetical protein
VDIIDAEKFITPLLKPNLSIEDIRSIVGEQLADHIVEHVTENTNEGFPLDKAQQLLESAKNFSKNSPKYIKAQIILNIILEKGFKPPFNPAQKRAIDDIYEAYTNPNLSKAERKSIIANAAKQFGLTDADFAELEGRIGVAIETMPEEDKEIYGQQIRDTEGIAKQNQEVYQNMGWNKAAAAAGALADTCRNVINSLNTNQRNADNVQRAAAGLDATSSVNAPPPTPDMVSGTFTASQLSVGDVQSRLEAARKELGDTIEQIDAEQIEKNIESNKNFEKELSAAAEARLAEAETILTVASGNPRLLELATRLIDSAAQSTAVIKEIANSPDIRELDKQITVTPNGTKKTEQQTRRNEVVQAKVRQTLAVQAEAMQEISRILNDTLGNDPNAEILKSGLFGYSKDVLIISQLAMTIKGRIEELQNIAKTIEDSSSQEWKNLQKTIETMATDYREFERAIKNYQMKIEEGRVSKKVKEDMEDIEFDLPADIGHRNNIPSRLIREAINDLNKSLGLNELGFRENVLEDLPEEIRAQVENEEHLPEILQQMAQNNPEKLIQLAMGFNGLNEKEKSAVLKALEHMDPLQLMALYQSYKSVLPEAVKNKIEQILGDKLAKDQEQPELVTA